MGKRGCMHQHKCIRVCDVFEIIGVQDEWYIVLSLYRASLSLPESRKET